MNILQVLPELNVGGVETGTLDLAKGLVRLGHKVTVVSNGGELVGELESLGGLHYQLPVHRKSLFNILRMIPRLEEVIEKEKIDIVHARSRIPAWIAFFAAAKTNRVFITTCHGYYHKHPLSLVMGWGKRVIAISNVIARHMVDHFGVPYERIKLIPRSVDLEKFRYLDRQRENKDKFNVGIIGRITPIKGHLYFIKAMAKVIRVAPGLKIWIVGDPPPSREGYKEQLRILVKRLGLSHCTEFLGTQKDIPSILNNLDLVVLSTTTQEAFGRVIIEAQACGVPVVATSVGGVVDIIEDGKNGLLVPPADPQAMAEAAIKVFQEPELARKLAQAAYAKVRSNYTIELMTQRTVDVYREALGSLKLLLVKFSSAGDVILSTAAIRAIREKFPRQSLTDNRRNNYAQSLGQGHPPEGLISHKISFLVGEEARDILSRCPYIDELLVCNFKGGDKGPAGLLRLGADLRKKGFDIVIDLQNNRKSHILSRLTLAEKRYGYDNKKFGFLLNRRLKDERPALSPVSHQFRILNMLGIELRNPHLELWPSEDDVKYIDELLQSEWVGLNQKMVGINISASQRWPTKNWPLRHMLRLCEKLGQKGRRVVITGTGKDAALAGKLAEGLKDVRLINACGKTTINQLACLIKKCSVYISSDSAPLHIASAVDTPFVALFGPTDPLRHLPWSENYVVIKKDLDCTPCYKTKCKNKRCMEYITVEEVLEAVDKLSK